MYRGENAAHKFIERMIEEERWCHGIRERCFDKPLRMTNKDEQDFDEAVKCHICGQFYSGYDICVRDHCHVTGKYRGSAHQSCNVNFQLSDKIPVVFRNLRGYNSHFIMQQISKIAKNRTYKDKKGRDRQMEINVIPNNMEKYMAFT